MDEEFDIDRHMPALAIIMAIAIQQGGTPQAHQLTVNVLRQELERAVPQVAPPIRESLEEALSIIAYHEDQHCTEDSIANTLKQIKANGMDDALARILTSGEDSEETS